MAKLEYICRDHPYHCFVYRVKSYLRNGRLEYVEYLQCVHCYRVFPCEDNQSCQMF